MKQFSVSYFNKLIPNYFTLAFVLTAS